MQKTMLMLAVALGIVGCDNSAEAANRLQAIRSAVPKVVNATIKVGDDLSAFFWRNKVAITTGTLLVTAATCPEVFVDGAVAVASGPPVIVQNYESVVQKRTRQIPWQVFGGMIVTLILGVMYATGGRSRTAAKIVAVVLLLGGALLFTTTAWAGPGMVEAVAGRSIWSYLLDLVLILLMLTIPLG